MVVLVVVLLTVKHKNLYLILAALFVQGCAMTGMPQSFGECDSLDKVCVKGPTLEPSTTKQLLDLPFPNQKTVVAVYSFSDLTGQRKASDTIASFSTAVTQGASHILVEALRDAGKGNWFVVVERGGLDNLTKERQLVRSTFESYNKDSDGKTILKPLLYAGMIIAVSYTNLTLPTIYSV